MEDFSHYSSDGTPQMVDVSPKGITSRLAKATGFVKMAKTTVDAIENKLLPKGNPFEIAKVAGIMGAKQNSNLIPMCHPLLLNFVDVNLLLDKEKSGIYIESEVKVDGKTGVEMEALTAVSIAALTVYDMCKAIDKNMEIGEIKVTKKTGGKSDFFLQKK